MTNSRYFNNIFQAVTDLQIVIATYNLRITGNNSFTKVAIAGYTEIISGNNFFLISLRINPMQDRQ